MLVINLVIVGGVVAIMIVFGIIIFQTLREGRRKEDNHVDKAPGFSRGKIIKQNKSLRIGKRSDTKSFMGVLELYDAGIVIRRGFLMENEEFFAIDKRDIIEVGVPRFSEILAFGQYIRWFYIEYRVNDNKSRFYVASAALKDWFKFKIWREEWFQAFRSVGVLVRGK